MSCCSGSRTTATTSHSQRRFLPFNGPAARRCAALRAQQERAGSPRPREDLMIAATAQANDATVATRDTGDFEGLGVEVINPWDA